MTDVNCDCGKLHVVTDHAGITEAMREHSLKGVKGVHVLSKAEWDAFDVSVFDEPTRGLGSDGNVHSDPYCAMIAPLGSYEAKKGELCEMCEEREHEYQEKLRRYNANEA